jgi:hypothetical protein
MGELIQLGVQILDDQEQQEILDSIKRIETINKQVTKGCMELGWEGAAIQSKAEKGSWGVAGFKDQHDFRVTKGIGRANWYRHVGVAMQFIGHIGKATYLAMKMENAERLSVEKEYIRFDPKHLGDAAVMSVKEFGDLLTNLVAHEEGKSAKKKYAEIRLRMEEQQRDFIESGIKSWGAEHGIDVNEDGIGYALQCIIADVSERPTLVGFLLESIPKLAEAARQANDLTDLRALIVDFVMEMNNQVHICCGEMSDETEDVA